METKPEGWGRGRKRKYHFADIEPGKNVFYKKAKINAVTNACYVFRKKYDKLEWKFTMRTEKNGVRVLRLR